MSGYFIKTVGIDLAPVSIGLATLGYRSGSWEATVLDAGVIHLNRNRSASWNQTEFNAHLSAGHKILEYVKKQKPDLVGVEDYTNQNTSYIGFSMGQMGGIVRTLLWQHGFRQLLIVPARTVKIVLPQYGKNDPRKISQKSGDRWKRHCIEWVEKGLNCQFAGTPKQRSDMADATIYALIASCFFCYYWLGLEPPLSARQREVFYNHPPNPRSKLAKKGWKPTGLMDLPYSYLIRNPAKEAETYTPEWAKANLEEVRLIV
jgi:Holliday junction resolvasome RuvABC endonuclease subunit